MHTCTKTSQEKIKAIDIPEPADMPEEVACLKLCSWWADDVGLQSWRPSFQGCVAALPVIGPHPMRIRSRNGRCLQSRGIRRCERVNWRRETIQLRSESREASNSSNTRNFKAEESRYRKVLRKGDTRLQILFWKCTHDEKKWYKHRNSKRAKIVAIELDTWAQIHGFQKWLSKLVVPFYEIRIGTHWKEISAYVWQALVAYQSDSWISGFVASCSYLINAWHFVHLFSSANGIKQKRRLFRLRWLTFACHFQWENHRESSSSGQIESKSVAINNKSLSLIVHL